MAKKRKFDKKKLTGAAALIVILAGGGYYLAVQNKKPAEKTPEAQVQENLEAKEQSTQNENKADSNTASQAENSASNSTDPAVTQSSLSGVTITGTKDGSTVYLSAYGISAGKYEVEKNGSVVLAATDYVGHGGLALPNLTEASAKFQLFQIVNGKRTASSKIINVTSSFVGTKEFTGA